MSDPIANDIAYVDALIENSNSSSAVLSANAQRAFDLRDSLINNTQLAYSKIWMDTFIAGRVDYLNNTIPGITTFIANSDPAYGYYGNRNVFHGNLDQFTITNSSSGIIHNTTSSLVAGTYPLSAGPTYYSLLNRITFSAPTTAVHTDVLFAHTERYSFVCQYVWSDPNSITQTKQLSAIPAVTKHNVKYGVDFNARSLLTSASAMRTDVTFYKDKQKYLSQLI